MIVSRRYNFVFIHIPKCAGSSVRQQIADYDEENGRFSRIQLHPTLGRADFGHLTLAQLREHLPRHFGLVRSLDSFAISRDPFARFGSALRQTLWMYDQRPMTLIPPAELAATTRRIVDDLAARGDDLPPKYVFFRPQRDYVFDGAERIVRNLYPIEATGRFLDELGRRTGRRLDAGRKSNQNVELRYKQFGRPLFAANALMRRILPRDLHATLKAAVLPMMARRESAAQASGLLDLPEVRQFVIERYADDFEIHRTALREVGLSFVEGAA